jgi:preprotein translocase subunit YajC
VGIPGAVFVVLVLACLIVVVVLILVKYTRNRTDDWEIEYSELDMGEQLGTGGYGAVHKAMWKGTEVAVKVMAAEKVTKEMEKSFQDEVHTHTLAH